MPLLDVASPAAIPVGGNPAARARRLMELKLTPRMAVGWVFKHAAIAAHCIKRSLKTSAIIAKSELVRLAGATMPEPTPPLARRVSDHGPWPGISASVAINRPDFHVRQVRVNATVFDKQRRDLSHLSLHHPHPVLAPQIVHTRHAPARSTDALPHSGHTSPVIGAAGAVEESAPRGLVFLISDGAYVYSSSLAM